MNLEKPLLLFWDLTNRCNLSCNFCMWKWEYTESRREINREQKELILNEILETRPLKVILTGGEPLLCQGIFHYIEKLHDNDIFVELTTNGTLLNQPTVTGLKEAGIDKIQVSLHGSKPEINDVMMGGDAFNRILNGLQLLNEEGLRFKIKTTLTSDNIDDLESLIVLLKESGTEHISISEYIPMGAGFKNDERLRIPLNKLKYWKNFINEHFDSGIDFNSWQLDMTNSGHPTKCTLGDPNTYIAQILWDGNLIPCSLGCVFNFPNSVLELGLRETWNNLDKFSQFNSNLESSECCGGCDMIEQCNGGCRALSYVSNKTVNAPDPRCIKFKNQEKSSKVAS